MRLAQQRKNYAIVSMEALQKANLYNNNNFHNRKNNSNTEISKNKS